jgi:predicted transcriptional regulator
MFKNLDPLLHSQVRLSIMTILLNAKSAEFSFLLENIDTTKGNLSFQITKLKEASYIRVIKSFRKNYPLTTLQITETGINAYENYIASMNDYFNKSKQNQ